MHDAVQVPEQRTIFKTGIVALTGLEGEFTAETQVRCEHQTRADVHKRPIEGRRGVKGVVAESIDALARGLGISAGCAHVSLEALRVCESTAYKEPENA